jgi:glycosyltransferase involved in cell wall biosynthesis
VPVVMTLHNYRLICSNALLFRNGRPCEDCVGSHPWHGLRHRCYRGSSLGSAAAAANIALHQVRGTWLNDVDLFMAPDEFSKARLVAAGIPAEKIIEKPNFVDDPGPRKAPPSESKEVLFVGRIASEKGILQLLSAWRRASPSELELVVVGDGPLMERARVRADGNIRLLGRLKRAEARRLMLSARALVVPSLTYDFQPMVLLEALAAGLPVLASDLGDTPRVLSALGQEWLASPGRVEQWSRALSALGGDSRVDWAGERARSTYCARFTSELGLRNLERVYARALSVPVSR